MGSDARAPRPLAASAFVIEDEAHAERMGKYASFDDAANELRRLAHLPWHKEPNAAPCLGWRTCGRSYQIVEYDASSGKQLRCTPALTVSAEGSEWLLPQP
jgi:hypothetical protein